MKYIKAKKEEFREKASERDMKYFQKIKAKAEKGKLDNETLKKQTNYHKEIQETERLRSDLRKSRIRSEHPILTAIADKVRVSIKEKRKSSKKLYGGYKKPEKKKRMEFF